jgi:nitrogenase subunit NifH
MNTTEILEAIVAQVEVLKAEHEKTTIISRKRARSAANAIKKLAAEFKRTSGIEDKA